MCVSVSPPHVAHFELHTRMAQGTHDPVCPPAFAPILRGLVADAGAAETQLVHIEGALHDLVWENPEEVGLLEVKTAFKLFGYLPS